jgi:Lrp/AsnC family leucine-responsive transcriptional regulator
MSPAKSQPKEQLPDSGISLDATDIRLLTILQENGRYSTRQLAAKVNLSATPVHERVKKLETSGVIDHYTAVINQDKLRSLVVFYVNINLKEHSTLLGTEFIKSMLVLPEVTELYTIGGEHDFMARVVVRDMAAYRNFFVEKLGLIPNIAKLQSIIVLDSIKREIKVPL